MDRIRIGSGQTWIQDGLGLGPLRSDWNWFGFDSVRVISGSGLYPINKILGQFELNSGFESNWINMVSGRFGFGLVQIGFRSRSVQLFADVVLDLVSSHSVRVMQI